MKCNETKFLSSGQIMAVFMSLLVIIMTTTIIFRVIYTISPFDFISINNYNPLYIVLYVAIFTSSGLITFIFGDIIFEFELIAALRDFMIKMYSFYIGITLTSGTLLAMLLFFNNFPRIDFDPEMYFNIITISIITSIMIVYFIHLYYFTKSHIKIYISKILKTIPPYNKGTIDIYSLDKNNQSKKYSPTKIRHLRDRDLRKSYAYSVFYLFSLLLAVASINWIDHVLTENDYVSMIPVQDGLEIVLSIVGLPSKYTNQFIGHFNLSSIDIVALGTLFAILVGPGVLLSFNLIYIIEKKLSNLTYIFSIENKNSQEEPASQLGFLFGTFVTITTLSVCFLFPFTFNIYVGLISYVTFSFVLIKSEFCFKFLLVIRYSIHILLNKVTNNFYDEFTLIRD